MTLPAAPLPTAPPPLVGVFASGLGGLSVLSALHRTLPAHPMHYVADSGNAPYGERSDAFVTERTLAVGEHLVASGAKLIVVACNTATAVAVAALRERWPEIPVVGVEPALKPAVKSSATGRIGVMATPATLRSAKFQRLLDTHRGNTHVTLQPCPGLAGHIERGDLDAPDMVAVIESFCAPLRAAGVDTVVLGCTHYPFVRRHIQAAMGPQVELIDTAWPVSRQAARLLGVEPLEASPTAAVNLQTTGDVPHLQDVASRWLDFPCDVSAAPKI
jgi:glutamate racemase